LTFFLFLERETFDLPDPPDEPPEPPPDAEPADDPVEGPPVDEPPWRAKSACPASVLASWESEAFSSSRYDIALRNVCGGDLALMTGLRWR
jgi:hypothetical protein